MIRMGRGSRTDQTNEVPTTNSYQPQTPEPAASSLAYQYTGENPSTTRPVTDSESMARDIKEGRLSGFVGHGTTLTGETTFQAMLRVDGHLVGSIASDSGTLIVGANGQVDANISVATATINGMVNGDIVASERIQLGRTAKVIGNIQTPKLTIEEGAIFEGGCTMLKAREAVDTQAAESHARYEQQQAASYATSTAREEDEVLARITEEEEEEESADRSEVAAM